MGFKSEALLLNAHIIIFYFKYKIYIHVLIYTLRLCMHFSIDNLNIKAVQAQQSGYEFKIVGTFSRSHKCACNITYIPFSFAIFSPQNCDWKLSFWLFYKQFSWKHKKIMVLLYQYKIIVVR